MSTPLSFPELRGNFTAVPDVAFDLLLKAGLAREELVVTLFLVHKNYEFERSMTLVPLEAIVAGTDLDQLSALQGLKAALGRGTVLQFHTESASNPVNFYLLNTEENRRVMAPILPELGSSGSRPAMAEPSPLSTNTASLAEAAEAAVRAPAPPAPAPTPEARARQEPPLPPAPAGAATAPSGGRRGMTPRGLARIIKAIGRELTKDERTRLQELDASEDRLLAALDSLEKRQIEIYSSDLIIYEYESARASERRADEDSRRREELDKAKVRQRACKRCNGLGYIFIGVNTVDECVCRKAR